MAHRIKIFAAAYMLALAGGAQADGTWKTTLLGRDVDGNAVAASDASAVFLYNTTLNITWLRNADMNGPMTWDAANAWARNLVVGAIDDWRLPHNNDCQGYDCKGGEMGHLWYVELGNPAGEIVNPGDFLNLQVSRRTGYYWSDEQGSAFAWTFSMASGYQSSNWSKWNSLYAMAVRPGDVLAGIPEPATSALLLTGLGVLGAALHRRRRG